MSSASSSIVFCFPWPLEPRGQGGGGANDAVSAIRLSSSVSAVNSTYLFNAFSMYGLTNQIEI